MPDYLAKHPILITVKGSRCYNIHTDESDIDIGGVFLPDSHHLRQELFLAEKSPKHTHLVEPYRKYLTDEEKEIASRTKLEGTVFELRKFITLASKGSPNELTILFCRDEEVKFTTPEGELLRKHRHLFLSSKIRNAFVGYAVRQERLLGKVRESSARSDYDTKAAVHMCRLYHQAHVVLDQQDFPVFLTENSFLMDIRRGVVERKHIDAYANKFRGLIDTMPTDLPDQVDKVRIGQLCEEIMSSVIKIG